MCGICCTQVQKAIVASALLAERIGNPEITFPYEALENGHCEKLVEGKCSVYEDRPLICQIDKMGEILGYNQKEWHKLNALSCNTLISEAGLGDEFIINLAN